MSALSRTHRGRRENLPWGEIFLPFYKEFDFNKETFSLDAASAMIGFIQKGRMRQVNVAILLLLAIMLFGLGCVSEPGIDKGKFSELNRTAHDLKASITPDKPCDLPEALLQKLASGTAALKDKTASKIERDVVEAYSRLVTTYQDGLLLCQSQTRLNNFQFVPKGRIYVFQDLDPLVAKYDLSTESHLYKPTGVRWRSISADSIKVIWETAENQLRNIENMVNYN